MSVAAPPLMARRIELESRGVRLEYVERGDPAGRPVIFLHGVTDSWGSFEEVLGLLPETLRAIAISLRGHGNSSRPRTGYQVSDMSADLLAFMDRLELPRAVIVGHSMGSFIAQRFAIDHPERVAGLVLMSPTATTKDNPVLVEIAEQLSTLVDPIDPGFVREFQAGTLARPVDPALFHAVVLESLKVPAHAWREMFQGFLTLDWLGEIHRISAPTLIAAGQCDQMFGEADWRALYEGIPDSTMVVYAGGGHGYHWEDAATFSADLAEFCRRLAD